MSIASTSVITSDMRTYRTGLREIISQSQAAEPLCSRTASPTHCGSSRKIPPVGFWSIFQKVMTLREFHLTGENSFIGQRDLTSRVGISVDTTYYCLSMLAERGFIELAILSTLREKHDYSYLRMSECATTKAQLTLRLSRRKLAEFETIEAEIADLKREITHSTHIGVWDSEP